MFLPVNGKFLTEKGEQFGTTRENFLYNGAYLLDKFEPQNERVLVKNDTYWDKDNVLIDRIRYKYNKEAATVAPELFLRGEIDTATIPTSIIDEWLKDDKKNCKYVKRKIIFIRIFMRSTLTHNLLWNMNLKTGRSQSIIKISENRFSMR